MAPINSSETEEIVSDEIPTYTQIVQKAYDAIIENMNEGFCN